MRCLFGVPLIRSSLSSPQKSSPSCIEVLAGSHSVVPQNFNNRWIMGCLWIFIESSLSSTVNKRNLDDRLYPDFKVILEVNYNIIDHLIEAPKNDDFIHLNQQHHKRPILVPHIQRWICIRALNPQVVTEIFK